MLNFEMKLFGKASVRAAVMILVFITLLSTCIFAANISSGQDIAILEAGKTLDGPGFFGGRIIRIDGNVEGTTFAAGQDVMVNGNINGDLFVAAQSVNINGKVEGNIYSAGQNLTLTGQSMGDVFIAGQDIKVDSTAMIERDLFASGYRIIQEGTVQRDFIGGGSDISINGSVGRDTELDALNVEIKDKALLSGDLVYRSEIQANIAPGSTITGKTDWTKVDRTPSDIPNRPLNTLTSKFISIASALLVWFVIRVWKPEFWKKTSELISKQPLRTLGIGAIALIVTPVLIILVMITVIGIPLGIMAGLTYSVSLYLSKIIAAVLIGSLLAERFGWSEMHKGVWLTLLGLLIVTGLGMIPFLGFLVWLTVSFAGLGAIIVSNFRTQKSIPE